MVPDCMNGFSNHSSTEKLKLTYLAQCTPVDIEFHDLCYSVPLGKKGQTCLLYDNSYLHVSYCFSCYC